MSEPLTRHQRYNRSEKGLARSRRYNTSEKGRERNRNYEATPARVLAERLRGLSRVRF